MNVMVQKIGDPKPPPQTNFQISTTTSPPIQPSKTCSTTPLEKSIAILLFTYNRPHYLNQTLSSLLSLPQISKYHIYISQDGAHPETTDLLQNYLVSTSLPQGKFNLWRRERDASIIRLPPHAALASHYKFALDKLFSTPIVHEEVQQGMSCKYEQLHDLAIIIEDDMKFAPDFLNLFEQTYSLLYSDETTLWCISSYNYHGFNYFDLNPKRLKRTNIFPGLGWMLRRELYINTLRPKWPIHHWDLWLRGLMQLNQTDCIYPEVSRNYNFGESGANVKAEEYNNFFLKIRLQEEYVPTFDQVELLHSSNYESHIKKQLQSAEIIPSHPSNLIDIQQRIDSWTRNKQEKQLITSFTKDQYADYMIFFKLFRSPLNSYKRMIDFKPTPFVTIYLGDARTSDLLPVELKMKQKESIVQVVGQQGQSCDQVCSEYGNYKCSKEDLEYVNQCHILGKYFSCTNGCAIETGSDLPNFVSDVTNDVNFGKCLIGEGKLSCSGKHASTSRLCACEKVEA